MPAMKRSTPRWRLVMTDRLGSGQSSGQVCWTSPLRSTQLSLPLRRKGQLRSGMHWWSHYNIEPFASLAAPWSGDIPIEDQGSQHEFSGRSFQRTVRLHMAPPSKYTEKLLSHGGPAALFITNIAEETTSREKLVPPNAVWCTDVAYEAADVML
ncbi:unnamed protein product [Phytophthora lilii]|uniref:Unnamed protein product n=1 Tax=Phytophthora lilii TaxID=2077276 RepID=A0A9W6TLI4_9STRA|nr:unnamed protein product [Phytophthora lilii]